MTRPDPYRSFRFRLEVQGTQLAGFQSVGGLERTTRIEPYREGGVNDFEHQLVVQTTYPPLMLKRGLVDGELWDWHQDVIDGLVERRTVSIALMDDAGSEVWRWICLDAFPSKWTGSDLDATGNAVAIETVELVHHGLRRQQ
ncbi:phage tail protein [Ruegeria sp. MALMAid1280]|uniref:phage tail protein n=1 Tax=Ruegeria sp. MALMAid1280 TaxID=3411634 RepID=UPI003BA10842